MHKISFDLTNLKVVTYYELDFTWGADNYQKLLDHLKSASRYEKVVFGDQFKATDYDMIRHMRDQYAEHDREINQFYKGTFQMRHQQSQELYDQLEVIYKVPVRKYIAGKRYIQTQKYGVVVFPEELQPAVKEAIARDVVVAITKDGEFKTYLVLTSHTEASNFCQPMVNARYDFIKYYDLVKDKYPELAELHFKGLQTEMEKRKCI